MPSVHHTQVVSTADHDRVNQHSHALTSTPVCSAAHCYAPTATMPNGEFPTLHPATTLTGCSVGFIAAAAIVYSRHAHAWCGSPTVLYYPSHQCTAFLWSVCCRDLQLRNCSYANHQRMQDILVQLSIRPSCPMVNAALPLWWVCCQIHPAKVQSFQVLVMQEELADDTVIL